MRAILKESWKADMLEQIRTGTFLEYRTAFPVAATFLIMNLSAQGVAFRLLNLGAGVKLITTRTDICP